MNNITRYPMKMSSLARCRSGQHRVNLVLRFLIAGRVKEQRKSHAVENRRKRRNPSGLRDIDYLCLAANRSIFLKLVKLLR
jgi:hypothetical protein